MAQAGWIGWIWPDTSSQPAARRDRIAQLVALATVLGLAGFFILSKGTAFLMPGPLTSAHGAIETCSTCHTKSGANKLSWMHGLVAGDPLADSKACLTCHKMPDTAFKAHGASPAVLQDSTARLMKVAARTQAPASARAQHIVAPTKAVLERDVYCATCHQEHQGANFSLAKISNEQCRSCHVVQFESFDRHHPKFDNYPFQRRTRIVFDHAGHFGKHYPEVAKKELNKRIPETCSTCHSSGDDKRVMAVAPFDQTCSGCHLNQITGKERATGPKGVAFLSVPGLDLRTLAEKGAAIGEWPEASEAPLTPFMKVMISRNEQGRKLLKTVDKLNLQDLASANAEEIKAVSKLAWEVKGLFYALMKGKASDVLGDLDIGGDAKLSPTLVADLTASLPRDVVASAQQQWLPSLATEMASRADAGALKENTKGAVIPNSALASPEELFDAATTRPGSAPRADVELAQATDETATPGRVRLPSGTPRSIRTDRETPGGSAAKPKPNASGNEAPASKDAATPQAAPAAADKAKPEPLPPDNPGKQTDDLLFPTEEELNASKSGSPDTAKAPAPSAAPAAGSSPGASSPGTTPPPDATAKSLTDIAKPRAEAVPVVSIESDVDPESWAEYGGWYRQDFAIFYRPAGHKDKFIYSWLYLTGPKAKAQVAGKGVATPAAAVFNALTGKDAQGSCTKCHSVDDIQGKGRLVNFSPPSGKSKLGRFTNFIHEPHFGIMENRGCLTCHKLEKDRPYLKSYEQGDPHTFASNFSEVKKELCQGCHTANMARQDCLTCHKYHVNGVVTPIISTKLPLQ